MSRVVRESEHVSVDQGALEGFADTIKSEELGVPPLFEKNDSYSPEQNIAFGFVYNAINFSYWGDPKWTIDVDGKRFDGGFGMLHALQRGISEGYDLLSADYLSSISEEDLSQILRGNIEIPLFKERLTQLQSLGSYISGHYGGSFTAFVDDCNWDAVELVERLADTMTLVFDDKEFYRGELVKFYKRAQLVPSHMHELWQQGVVGHDITRMDELTALADYKVPQVLRRFNILHYTPELADKIDGLIELEAGSEEEVEIRAMTIWAVELLARYLRDKGLPASSIKVDHVLWLRGQVKLPNDKPYHLTRTINY